MTDQEDAQSHRLLRISVWSCGSNMATTSFGQKTQMYPFHRTYAPTFTRSSSCIPLRDGSCKGAVRLKNWDFSKPSCRL